MKTRMLAVGFLLAVSTSFASETKSPWSIRLRATYLHTTDHSDAVGALIPTSGIKVSDRIMPEIDLNYAFNANWSAELVLTVPQEHDVRVNKGALSGAGLGSFKHLPPTLFLQYRPDLGGRFRPYLGAGVNFTLIFETISRSPARASSWTITASDRRCRRVSIMR